jgi:6-phosphofructokinase 2
MALFETLKERPYLIKPNLREIEHLLGRKTTTPEEEEQMCRQLVEEGGAEIVALSLGPDCALLVSGEQTVRLPAPDVRVKSTVGAGDSFVAGMTMGLASGFALEDAFALGVSTGTATVMTAETELCRREDVERFYEEIVGKSLSL